MIMQRMQTTRTVALALGLLVPSTTFAKAVGSVAVERIETKASGDGREIVILTSKDPTFSVFRINVIPRRCSSASPDPSIDALSTTTISSGAPRASCGSESRQLSTSSRVFQFTIRTDTAGWFTP